jgi:hypothetical protein
MPYVRTVLFTVPPARTHELNPGHNLFLATTQGTQIAAQYMHGYHRSGVWMQPLSDGSVKVFLFTQWYDLANIDEYVQLPMIRDFERDVATYLSRPVIEIYEVMV